jgi:hypothetical protein
VNDLARRGEDAFGFEGVRWSEIGIEFPVGFDYGDWQALGVHLGRAHGSIQWALGDWFVYGEGRYRDGEMYEQALEDTGRSLGGLMNLKSVASRVPPSIRRADLSWSHHREIAKLEQAKQREWLSRAAEGDWSVDLLRDTLRAERDLTTRLGPGPAAPEPLSPDESAVVNLYRELKPEFGDKLDAGLVARALTGTLERARREEEAAERRRQLAATAGALPASIELRQGDFREVLGDLVCEATAVITDPPYQDEADGLYPDLVRVAAELLSDEGTLVVLAGTRPRAWLNRLPRMVSEKLPLRWVGVYLTGGAAYRDHQSRIATNWKPLLIFGGRRPLNTDVFRSNGDDKRHHLWGQNEQAFGQLVEAFTDPGDLVVDPFVGAGTTAVACHDLGRRFVGCDVDAEAIAVARGRVAEEAGS